MALKANPDIPDRMYLLVRGLTYDQAREAAITAVQIARRLAPKLSGASARRIMPMYGNGFFGVRWLDNHLYFQEAGIRSFTMTGLAGKTIPMWIDDPTGSMRSKNPKAKTRTTASGKVQVLIFRRSARIGQMKTTKRKVGGATMTVEVPASYPGAPGRIGGREARNPYTTPGRVGGRIARGNVGVRWRHPGLHPRNFLHQGIMEAAHRHKLVAGELVVANPGMAA